MTEQEQSDAFYRLLAAPVRRLLILAGLELSSLQEIRMRVGRPLLLRYAGQEYGLCMDGRIGTAAEGIMVSRELLEETLSCFTGYSLYAFDEELRQGFLTVPGGHRIGVAGRTVADGGQIQCIRNISFLNIRLAHQKQGCADVVLPYLVDHGRLCNTLILSPPGCGKTTLLRDLIRQISDGSGSLDGYTVGVVDERSELAGSYLGVPQNDIGMRTDVLDCCPRAEGIMLLLRSMAPQVIAVDELGGSSDVEAIVRAFYCGCTLIATMHGSSYEDICGQPLLRPLVDAGVFERYLVLSGRPRAGTLQEIRSKDGGIMMAAWMHTRAKM